MPRRSPAAPGRATSRERAAWLPAPIHRPDPGSPGRAGAPGAPPCVPPAAGTGAPAEPRLGLRISRPVKLAYLDRTAVFHVRVSQGQLNRLVVIRRFHQVEAAEDLFRLAV